MPNGAYSEVLFKSDAERVEYAKSLLQTWGINDTNRSSFVPVVKNYLNNKLKNCKSYQDFREFQKELGGFTYYYTIDLRGKRRHYEAYAFEQHPINPNKVVYLYNDSVSTGSCRIDLLHRYLEVFIYPCI